MQRFGAVSNHEICNPKQKENFFHQHIRTANPKEIIRNLEREVGREIGKQWEKLEKIRKIEKLERIEKGKLERIKGEMLEKLKRLKKNRKEKVKEITREIERIKKQILYANFEQTTHQRISQPSKY